MAKESAGAGGGAPLNVTYLPSSSREEVDKAVAKALREAESNQLYNLRQMGFAARGSVLDTLLDVEFGSVKELVEDVVR